jgi:hypothetical protein
MAETPTVARADAAGLSAHNPLAASRMDFISTPSSFTTNTATVYPHNNLLQYNTTS